METPLRVSLLLLRVWLTWLKAQSPLAQSPPSLTVREGKGFTLNCSYTDGATNFFQWFKQHPETGAISLIQKLSNMGENTSRRVTAKLNEEDQHFPLHIRDLQLQDSAISYCAVSAQCPACTCIL